MKIGRNSEMCIRQLVLGPNAALAGADLPGLLDGSGFYDALRRIEPPSLMLPLPKEPIRDGHYSIAAGTPERDILARLASQQSPVITTNSVVPQEVTVVELSQISGGGRVAFIARDAEREDVSVRIRELVDAGVDVAFVVVKNLKGATGYNNWSLQSQGDGKSPIPVYYENDIDADGRLNQGINGSPYA